jgi:hypothetical protein
MTKHNVSTDVKANVLSVLEEIKRRVDNPSWDGEVEEWAESLDSILDDMKNNDQFGTEGQVDPRGDFRNGEFTIWNMEIKKEI